MPRERETNRRARAGDDDARDDDARLEQLARMHAALGEPVRLRIVDQLVLGDASPGELGEVGDLQTNLLAHHLKVLDEAGLIRRVRSEGDRRRSYVQLRWDDPRVAALVTATSRDQAGSVPRVMFVCTHNSARSQLAAAVWTRVSAIPAASAGTRPAARVHPRAVATGRRHGLTVGAAGTRQVKDAVQPGDLVVAVCDNAHEELVADQPLPDHDGPTGRGWLHWAVPDPVRVDTDAAFETAYTDLTHRVGRLAGALAPGGSGLGEPAPGRAR